MAVVERPVAFAIGFLLLLLCVPATAAPHEKDAATPIALPTTIQVDTLLEPLIAHMLEKSPTFRDQCRLIGSAKIVVAVHLVPETRNSGTHAVSTLRRYSSGLMVAHVEVPAAKALTQLIAHEFEHIAEFVEGVDLEALVAARPGEASRRLDGAFETGRAIAAGRVVQEEMMRR